MANIDTTPAVAVLAAGLFLVLCGTMWLSFSLQPRVHSSALLASGRRESDWAEEASSYRRMAELAVSSLERAAEREAQRIGRELPLPVAAVVPEHASPPSAQQQVVADVATLRARLVAATLALGLEADRV